MTSETDLSTADLAQTGGTRPQEAVDDEQSRTGRPGEAAMRTGDRTYESAGNRVAQDPGDQDQGDQDTVQLPHAAPSGGSTRNDAIGGAAPYPGRPDTGGIDRDTGNRGTGDMADRDMAEGDMANRGMTDRGMTDRGMTDRGMGDRGTGDQGGADGRDVALLDTTDAEAFRRRWSDTQARFVDDPREAVQMADALVAELMQTLASSFNQHKGELEAHWRSGGDPDTENLRQALQRYRSFFDRLLSA